MIISAHVTRALEGAAHSWLVTGAAGFIGSNLVETLLRLNQTVRALDNFATGHRRNLEQVRALVTPEQWHRLEFVEGDIREAATCMAACRGITHILHQAALGSVPRSLEDPVGTHAANVTGMLNLLQAAQTAGVRRFVYASSSSVYGDDPGLPKVEDQIGQPLSPYAASKWMNEIYAGVFARCYGLESIGLRYFNVFGQRQDPAGAYAAVIPKWVASMLRGERVRIHGDGETSRDFCYIANVVQANLLAALTTNPQAVNQAYNIAVGERAALNQLFHLLRDKLRTSASGAPIPEAEHGDFRAGDVRHSLADISKAQTLLGYAPTHTLDQGLDEALEWYQRNV